MHGYDLAVDPEDGTRLYMGADDGVVIHGSTQVLGLTQLIMTKTFLKIRTVASFFSLSGRPPTQSETIQA